MQNHDVNTPHEIKGKQNTEQNQNVRSLTRTVPLCTQLQNNYTLEANAHRTHLTDIKYKSYINRMPIADNHFIRFFTC